MDELIKVITTWPVCVLILLIVFLIIFRKPIANKISDISSVEGEGKKWKINMNIDRDKIIPSPQVIQPKGISQAVKVGNPTISTEKPKLAEGDIEKSKQEAQRRLDEDTRKVGYKRGELYLRDDKSYGIAWEVNLNDRIVIKDD